MSFISWIVLGLIAGFIGRKVINKTDDDVLSTVIFSSLAGAVIGAIWFLLWYHLIRRAM